MTRTNHTIPHTDKIPEIYCALAAVFNNEANTTQIINELSAAEISCIAVHQPKAEPTTIFEVAVVRAEKLWSIDEALSKLFLQIDKSLIELRGIVRKNKGQILVDIAFYQYGTYPTLYFGGDNMTKIHFLDANISIDPF